MGVHIPNLRGHTEAWESMFPTRGATPKSGSPYPRGARWARALDTNPPPPSLEIGWKVPDQLLFDVAKGTKMCFTPYVYTQYTFRRIQ